mmetsp:Transcript_12114/g.18059  ORF Transcript_12114/g.18059 Transcript_12114/m.18059 type:complete len:147 (+) Transcript_12114:1198-1638(+)
MRVRLLPKKETADVKDDSWDCPACTYHNTILPDKCQVCRTPNPNYRPDPALFPDLPVYSQVNDSTTRQQIIGGGGGGVPIDPTLIQQLQLASIPAWICPNCRVLNPRGTIRCALPDCRYPNPIVGGVPPPRNGPSGNNGQQQCIIS